MKVLENTPAVLPLGKLCDENGYSYEWINGQKTTSHQERDSDNLQYGELRSYRGSRLVKFFLWIFINCSEKKISAWNLTKVRSKKEVIDEAWTSGATVHFASLMDISHLKNAALEAKHQKYKGRVVLRGDIVKDDSGSFAAFTEQGSSASQMTAAKIMDIISRLPSCDGQAADAASAETQVKMEDAHKLLKIPKSECPDIWIRLPRHKWPKSWSSMENPDVPLERNLYGHPFGRTIMGKAI